MKDQLNRMLTALSPILGAGAVGACPLCWIGSASLLTYLGLGALIPVWRTLVLVLLLGGGIGFLLDFRSHRNIQPLIIFIVGALLLYVGRYVFGGPGFGGWYIWLPGGLLVLAAVIYNKSLFKKSHN